MKRVGIVMWTLAQAAIADNAPPSWREGAPPPAPELPAPQEQFMSTLQIRVNETDPFQRQRSQKIVAHELSEMMLHQAELINRPYQIRTTGNEVFFYLVTERDMRQPIQTAVSRVIEQLNGRVRARGRSHFYRASLDDIGAGSLEVRLSEDKTKIASISAQAVPLREVLAELKTQFGALSYLIPGECTHRLVDWSFGEAGPSEPKALDLVMSELAVLFGLHCEKRNGTYIFTGNCQSPLPYRPSAVPTAQQYITGQLFPPPLIPRPPEQRQVRNTQVYFPMIPME